MGRDLSYVAGSLPVILMLLMTGCVEATRSPGYVDLDVSGLAWVDGDTFLVVHDGKVPDEAHRPRVSLVTVAPDGTVGPLQHLDVQWPDGQTMPHDLESITRFPDTQRFLAAESGDDGEGGSPRLFLFRWTGSALIVEDVLPWIHPVKNVEAVTVAALGDQVYLLFAERAHGQTATELCWSAFRIPRLQAGAVECLSLSIPGADREAFRHASSLALSAEGDLYVVSAVDPGNRGPFHSDVWRIGTVSDTTDAAPPVRLLATPQHIDLAMRLGVNYPAGPLEWAEAIGLEEMLQALQDLQREVGAERLAPHPLLGRLVSAGGARFADLATFGAGSAGGARNGDEGRRTGRGSR